MLLDFDVKPGFKAMNIADAESVQSVVGFFTLRPNSLRNSRAKITDFTHSLSA